jgi:hypothetical protein
VNQDKKYLGGAQGYQGDEHEAVEQQHELQGEEQQGQLKVDPSA